MQSLRRTLPASLDDLTVQVALVRPGPIQGGAVHPYIERRVRRRADPDYEIPHAHPLLAPVLEETLGVIVFQDQVLEVSMALAGFSPGEAEGLRRAMSRKRSDAAILVYRDRFIEGAMERGVEREIAERIFEQVRGFSGFGFPKAHAAAFGLLAYQSTWLRVHYGPEFLCALLNEQPMGFYPPDALVHEAQRRGMEVLPPHINRSDTECRVEQSAELAVRIGLGYVQGVKEEEVKALVAERDRQRVLPGRGRSRGALGRRARHAREACVERRLRRPAAAGGAVADGRRHAGTRGARRGAAVAAAVAARGAGVEGAHRMGAAAGRLRLVQDQHRAAPDVAAATGPARDGRSRAAGSSASLTAAGCPSRASWSRASGPRPRRESRSCCSRTSGARST